MLATYYSATWGRAGAGAAPINAASLPSRDPSMARATKITEIDNDLRFARTNYLCSILYCCTAADETSEPPSGTNPFFQARAAAAAERGRWPGGWPCHTHISMRPFFVNANRLMQIGPREGGGPDRPATFDYFRPTWLGRDIFQDTRPQFLCKKLRHRGRGGSIKLAQ